MNYYHMVMVRQARERQRYMLQLAISACRNGQFAGFKLLMNECPKQLRLSEDEFQSWREGWQATELEAEEAKRTFGTIVWVNWLNDDPTQCYGVVNGTHPTDVERGEVTFPASPNGSNVYIPYKNIDTKETMSVMFTWTPSEKVLTLLETTDLCPASSRWNQVIARNDLIGSVMQFLKDDSVYCGPVKSIGFRGKIVIIELEWTARNDSARQRLDRIEDTRPLTVNSLHSFPQDGGNGVVSFNIGRRASAMIFPKGTSKADPTGQFRL